MQLNSTELKHIEYAIPSRSLPTFQLPTLHESIPLSAVYTHYQTNFGALGMQLLAAGVIDPEAIPEDALTPALIVRHGLQAWFANRIGRLEYIRVDAKLFDTENANAAVQADHWEGVSFERPAIALTGSTTDIRYVKDVALHVQSKVPDLFLTAFEELVQAGYRTVELQSPGRILEQEASYSLWGNDIHSVNDEEAAESLLERYGEDGECDYYMPDAMLEAFGNGYCFNIARVGKKSKKVRKFPDLLLKKLSTHKDGKVSAIASGLLKLRKAVEQADKLGAQLTRANSYDAQPIYVGCILLFSGDDREIHFMDDEAQQLWENGLGSEMYSIDQLPPTVPEIKSYFQKLDALLDLVAQMDALIPILSYSPNAE